jgi:hypothetical protein
MIRFSHLWRTSVDRITAARVHAKDEIKTRIGQLAGKVQMGWIRAKMFVLMRWYSYRRRIYWIVYILLVNAPAPRQEGPAPDPPRPRGSRQGASRPVQVLCLI